LLLFLVGLACLFPLAGYLLYLALLHHRGRPTMISGPWDFAGILAALSGFLLIGGTMLVFLIHSSVRAFWLSPATVADFENLKTIHLRAGAATLAIWGVYLLIVIGGSAVLLRLRRPVTIIYQLTPAELEDLLPAALDRLKLAHFRRGPRWTIGTGTLKIDGSTPMHHVTLRWESAPGGLRSDVEAELSRDLAAVSVPSSPAATWLMTVAAGMFTIMIFLLGSYLIISFRK
jgi:hypothetical protein